MPVRRPHTSTEEGENYGRVTHADPLSRRDAVVVSGPLSMRGEDVTRRPPSGRRVLVVAVAALVALVVAVVCGLVVGPTSIGTWRVVGDVLCARGHRPQHAHAAAVARSSGSCARRGWCSGCSPGSMLAVAGGTYQGVFRNPLADPYLLGVAAGAGLGATIAIIDVGAGTEHAGAGRRCSPSSGRWRRSR